MVTGGVQPLPLPGGAKTVAAGAAEGGAAQLGLYPRPGCLRRAQRTHSVTHNQLRGVHVRHVAVSCCHRRQQSTMPVGVPCKRHVSAWALWWRPASALLLLPRPVSSSLPLELRWCPASALDPAWHSGGASWAPCTRFSPGPTPSPAVCPPGAELGPVGPRHMTHRLGPTPSPSREDSGVTGAGLDLKRPLEHTSAAPVLSSEGQWLSWCPVQGSL